MMKTSILVLAVIVCLILIAYLALSIYVKISNLSLRKDEKEKPDKKKHEFSKLIFAFVSTVYIVVIVYSLIMMAITFDLTPLAYIIPATATELATATGFYYWKARAENKIKLKKEYDIPLSEDDFRGE